jgi:hypothetical protein
LGLVFILAEIHDLADRGFGVGRDLDQIEPRLFGHLHRARRGYDTDVFAICANQADFRIADAVIDAWAGFALRRGIVGATGYGGGP